MDKNVTHSSAVRRISFQGELGANSHIACRDVFPEHEVLPCATFEDAFAAVEDGSAEFAMIPIENSVAGRVADIHHLMPRSPLEIVGEYFLPISHQLLGVPGADLATLKTAQSHIMALGQCRNIIRQLGLRPVTGSDTAGSAREVAQAGDVTRGAIASRLAGELYGLAILAENIEDDALNTTRFVILSREKKEQAQQDGPFLTTLVFRVRNVPAALYKVLGGFATNGVNITKLESYQVGGDFIATQFYIDIDGHPEAPDVKRALEELTFFSQEVRILGTYPASPFRRAPIRSTESGS